jgi:hypothetical protein
MPAYEYEQLATDFHTLFGAKKQLDAAWLKKLQHYGWLGETSMSMRSISWRVLLGVLPPEMNYWSTTMEQNYQTYEGLKTAHLPDINRVKVDPLSSMCGGGEEDDEGRGGGDWDVYYKVSQSQGVAAPLFGLADL